jgi:transposase
MANKSIAMLILRKLILLLYRGFTVRAISSELRISHTTVVEYRKRIEQTGKAFDALLQLDDKELGDIIQPAPQTTIDPRMDQFANHLEEYLSELAQKRVTRAILHEEYLKMYPDGFKYSKFCQLLADASLIKKATTYNTYTPGDIFQFDFAGDALGYVDRNTGELIPAPVFVAVLPYSNYSYMEAMASMKLPDLIKCLNGWVAYMGGVTTYAKTDNMKQAVIRSSRYEPTFTEVIEQWCLHYGVGLLTARVRRPRDKGVAEGAVKIVYNQIYARMRNDEYFSLKDLNEAIKGHLDNLNHRPMQNRDYCRYQRFVDLEQPALKPLPDEPFILKSRAERTIGFNYHFKLQEDDHQYSVPYQYIGKKLTAVYDTDTVEIYSEMERILSYPRIRGIGYTTEEAHMPPNHQAYSDQKKMDGTYFQNVANNIGPATGQYIQNLLKSRRFQEQAYEACLGIIRMAKRVSIGSERLEWACKRGLRANNYSYSMIRNILKNNQDKLEKEYSDEKGEQPSLFHENIRGPESYK